VVIKNKFFLFQILHGDYSFLSWLFSIQQLAAVYIISFLVALVTQFFIPAETPLIPLIVNKKDLYSANALFGFGLYGSALFAYLLSGPIILIFGEVNALILLGLMFFISSLFISGIRNRCVK